MKQYQALLFKVVRAYAFTTTDQEDLFQEVALQVWRSIPNFNQQSAVSTWIYRVSLNTAMTWTRNGKKHQESRESIDNVAHFLRENPKVKDERLDWLYEEIANLNAVDRSLTLLLLDGFSYKEMATMLGISESNVGVKVHRIKKHLTTQAKRYHHHGI